MGFQTLAHTVCTLYIVYFVYCIFRAHMCPGSPEETVFVARLGNPAQKQGGAAALPVDAIDPYPPKLPTYTAVPFWPKGLICRSARLMFFSCSCLFL